MVRNQSRNFLKRFAPGTRKLIIGLLPLATALSSGSLFAQKPLTITLEPEELQILGVGNLPPEQARTAVLLQLKTLQLQKLTSKSPLSKAGAIGGAGGAVNSSTPSPLSGVVTEESIAAQLERTPALSAAIKIERQRDGFKVNGEPFLDPSGAIGLYSVNVLNGDITYFARPGSGQELIVKSGRVLTPDKPIVVARATLSGNTWSVSTTTGKTVNGDRLIPVSRGFLVARPGAAFLYQPGVGVKDIAVPEGYVIAQFQNGDIGSTRYLLLEKVQMDANPLGALGSLLGVSRKDDYALLDIDKGLPLYIDIPLESNTQMIMSNCYRKSANSIFNICRSATSFESLYDPSTGLPNYSHYYWWLSWFALPDGRKVLVSQQSGLSKVSITNMDTGSSSSLFERMLGIAGFSATQDSSGAIQVTAKLGFMRERIADAVTVLDGAEPKPEAVGGPSLF